MPYFGLLVFELIQQQALENFRPVAEEVKRVLASLTQCRIEVTQHEGVVFVKFLKSFRRIVVINSDRKVLENTLHLEASAAQEGIPIHSGCQIGLKFIPSWISGLLGIQEVGVSFAIDLVKDRT